MIKVIAHSDAGAVKNVNQDSISAKVVKTSKGDCFMCILCDGMGGLSDGELASTTCVRTFMDWFDRSIEMLALQPDCLWIVQKNWEEMIRELNERIGDYGAMQGIHLGTTLLAFFSLGHEYLIANVGDCRAYCLKSSAKQLTKDQTVVGLEVEKGLLTKEQANQDKRRNILLQCVGASREVTTDYFHGTLDDQDAILICSDGFIHVLSEAEITEKLSLRQYQENKDMQQRLIGCIDEIKARGERDNITALVAYFFN